MITGVVTADHQAIITLTLHGSAGQSETTDALLDTGFNGFLTLPLPQIAHLQFPYEGTMRVVLGNGQAVELDIFMGTATSGRASCWQRMGVPSSAWLCFPVHGSHSTLPTADSSPSSRCRESKLTMTFCKGTPQTSDKR
ncbi:MAG: hypothetical protein HYZ50_10570 [Deltaproteobacteria bacterium]|nr:hypothetical protein [Deltaproteobacteria bacterium]